MEIVNLMDLGFLTKEEQVIIQHVLKRDTDLRKREEKRIRKMKRQKLDLKCLKLQTGEWFEELREKRFKKYCSATDLLKCVLERKQPGTLSSKRISRLSKITSIETMQTALPSPPSLYDLPESHNPYQHLRATSLMPSKKRKGLTKPGKMLDFFAQHRQIHVQDGGRARGHRSQQERTDRYTDHGNPQAAVPLMHSVPTSASTSPAKSRQRMEAHMNDTEEVSAFNSSMDDTRELQDSITDFPTLNQPVMDTTLKDMLVSLRSTLHADIMAITQQFKTEVHAVTDRVSHVEVKMGEFAQTFNELVDAHNDREEDMAAIKAKLADLEDRSRRNNVRIRGIPESIQPQELREFFIRLMKVALPEAEDITRCHQVVEENIVTDEFTTVPNEQLSVTQILKDLEIILDLEIQNLNSTVEIADINGSSPENVLVDKTLSAVYNSHQVWHYPELMDMNTEQANLSPLTSVITTTEEDFSPCKYRFQLGENMEYANHDYLQTPHLPDPASSHVCSGQLETPFCSSPFLPEQFLFSENCFRFDSPSELNVNHFKVQSDHQSKDLELSSEQSLDTESTLEPTIIPGCSPIMTEDHMVWGEDVPLIDSNL
ncbi:uncharacterized protein LOC143986704 [Lithobates pipiens]